MDQIFGMPLKLLSGKWKSFSEKIQNRYSQAVILLIQIKLIVFDQ